MQTFSVIGYQISVSGQTSLMLPIGTKILGVHVSSTNTAMVLALVDKDAISLEERILLSVPTCTPFKARPERLKYLGTFHLHVGTGIYHVFEIFKC